MFPAIFGWIKVTSRCFLFGLSLLAFLKLVQPTYGEAPRLALAIVTDQFRHNYLDRFEPYFSENGFRRLPASRTNFEDCHSRHDVTKTSPGHATISSGVYAEVHGIVANERVDPMTWRVIESNEDHEFPLVCASPRVGHLPGGVLEAKGGRSPSNFPATTVGDQLMLRFGSPPRVFSVAHKDRSTILMAGKLADSAYWIVDGRIVTSTYYRDQLPDWIEEFNAGGRADKIFGQTWGHLLAPTVYDAVQGSDDAPGENTDFGFGRTMPKQLDGGAAVITAKFYEAFETTPAASALIGEFASLAFKKEQLGQHAHTDLLCVGFSRIDKMGHADGPDSHELMDSIVRLDGLIAKLLDTIDREAGLQNCVVVFTAHHGASPLPEHMRALCGMIPTGRLDKVALDAAGTAALYREFRPAPNDDYWCLRDDFGYHLRPSVLNANNVSLADAAEVARQALLSRPEIAQAFTSAEVLAMTAEGNSLGARSRRSFFTGPIQDMVFVLKPRFIDRPETGTNHGSPYDYDSHVPLLWFGAGVPAGRRNERVGVDDLAPTFAALLGVPTPPQAIGRRLF